MLQNIPFERRTGFDYPQLEVKSWVLETFSEKVASSIEERCLRFIEEANELVQALGLSKERAQAVLDYTYSRPAGEPFQEVGGTLITLLALTSAADIRTEDAFRTELERCYKNMEKIRAKNLAKPLKGSDLE